ncbi:hypothetical protein GC167_04260 [bacterium]|nr:hypothetical protein [bacterium]
MLKGHLLRHNPGVPIIDVSHDIGPYLIDEAAFVLAQALPCFPEDSLHLALVHDHRKPLSELVAARVERKWVVAPNNGLISLLPGGDLPEHWGLLPLDSAHSGRMQGQSLFLTLAETVRDLLDNRKPARWMPGTQASGFFRVQTLNPASEAEGRVLSGHVVYIDRFGNLVTNLHRDRIDEQAQGRALRIELPRNHRILRISKTYDDAAEGKLLALYNDSGWLEIALSRSKGSDENGAGRLLGISLRDRVDIHFIDPTPLR